MYFFSYIQEKNGSHTEIGEEFFKLFSRFLKAQIEVYLIA